MAHIEERLDSTGQKKYRVKIKIKGSPGQSATFRRKTDAKRWAQQTEAAIRERRHFKHLEATKHTGKQMLNRYIEQVLPTKGSHRPNQKIQLEWWKSKLGDYLLADITPALIVQCRDELLGQETRLKRKRAPATVNRYLAALSHCFTIAINEWGWMEDSPMRKVRKCKEPRGRVRFLSEDERKALLEACRKHPSPYLYPVVVLAISTGARRGEILSLRRDQVDVARGRITLYETKNNEIRSIPLTGHALELVKDLLKVQHLKTDLLFPGKKRSGRLVSDEDTSYKPIDIRAAWEEALKQSKIQDFRFHDLRHTTASYLAMNGATTAEIAEILGHKTLQMVKRYSHLTEQHTAAVLGRMNKSVFK
jgi:integrase